MNLPYVRTVDYLSPSSLHEFEQNPVEFYLRRLGPPEFSPPPDPQTFPMAVGSAFDAQVKALVAQRAGLPCPPLVEMLEANVTIEPASVWERAVKLGHRLMHDYVAAGACDDILDGGTVVGVVPAVEVRTAPGTQVPIYGEPDALLRGQTRPVALDWKVTGANRPGKASPRPGYVRLLSQSQGPKGPHPRASEQLEAINPEWATQLAIYGWLLGRRIAPARAAVDQVVVGEDDCRVAQFRTVIGIEFQRALRKRLKDAWTRIQEQRVVPEHLAACGVRAVRVLR